MYFHNVFVDVINLLDILELNTLSLKVNLNRCGVFIINYALHKICQHTDFCWPVFSRITTSRFCPCMGEYGSVKTRILAYFMQWWSLLIVISMNLLLTLNMQVLDTDCTPCLSLFRSFHKNKSNIRKREEDW